MAIGRSSLAVGVGSLLACSLCPNGGFGATCLLIPLSSSI